MTTKIIIEASGHRVLLSRLNGGTVDHQEIIEKDTTETVWLTSTVGILLSEVSDTFEIEQKVLDGGGLAADDPKVLGPNEFFP